MAVANGNAIDALSRNNAERSAHGAAATAKVDHQIPTPGPGHLDVSRRARKVPTKVCVAGAAFVELKILVIHQQHVRPVSRERDLDDIARPCF